uniref:Uncharacterized protein n=1 Tax=Periophthalmus magnuspinnatus TaxID=409849 RepID=A0A3B4A116_9GOBI
QTLQNWQRLFTMSDLDVSLRRSLVLGLEVLERASKRRVDWTRIRPMGHSLNSAQRESREERHEETKQKTPEHRGQHTHVCRFHSSSSAPLSSSAPASAPLYSSPREDFYIEVRPGTYSITTHLVSLNDGETVLLTFHL